LLVRRRPNGYSTNSRRDAEPSERPSGKHVFDARLWVEPRDQPGADLIPTKRGISVDVAFLEDLEEAIAAARQDLAPAAKPAA
jgi:hypothetical protein